MGEEHVKPGEHFVAARVASTCVPVTESVQCDEVDAEGQVEGEEGVLVEDTVHSEQACHTRPVDSILLQRRSVADFNSRIAHI